MKKTTYWECVLGLCFWCYYSA